MLKIAFASFTALAVSCVSSVSCVSHPTSLPAKTPTLTPTTKCAFTVLHTNDHHGHPVRFDNFPQKNVGGIPARLTAINAIRNSTKNVLVLDAGDFNTGRPESSFFDAKPDIEGYNAIGYDAVALGNHEFDKPLTVLEKQISLATFPFVNANVVDKKSGAMLANTKPFVVKNLDGCKVGIVGLTLSAAQETIGPENAARINIQDEIEAAKIWVPQIQKQADFVIALTHLGIENTNTQGSRRLAAQVPGIDLIVDGHTHTKLDAPFLETNLATQKNIPIVQAAQWGLVVGKTDVTVRSTGEHSVNFSNISIDSTVAEDLELKAKLDVYVRKLEPILNRKLGVAATAFEFGKHREKETPLANLFADAVLWRTASHKPDFVFVNGGSLRTGLAKGAITLRNIFEMLPYDNTMVLTTLTGEQVQKLFDTAAAVEAGKGAFPVVAGASVEFSRDLKKATRILIGGKALLPQKLYRVCTHSYLAGGGDGYGIFKEGQSTFDTSLNLRDAVAEFIQYKKRVSPQTDGRILTKNPDGTVFF
jgi:5'-nucleotidase/UDP-sugar diphosphatase